MSGQRRNTEFSRKQNHCVHVGYIRQKKWCDEISG